MSVDIGTNCKKLLKVKMSGGWGGKSGSDDYKVPM